MRHDMRTSGRAWIWAGLLCLLGLRAVWAEPTNAAAPFAIIALPDTQYYSWHYPETFLAQTAWVVSNRAALNIAFVTHLGDLCQHGTDAPEYEQAERAMRLLDGQVPYSTCIGNHDVKGGGELWDRHFGPARYQGKPWYGGASASGRSHWQTFQAGGYDFLHLNLEFGADSNALSWAQGVLDGHPGQPVIVSTHDYLGNGYRTANGQRIWKELVSRNPQIFMVLNGHVHGENRLLSTNAVGRKVIQMLSDYQDGPNGGDGFLRIIRFNIPVNRIEVQTYSPTLNDYVTGPKSQFACAIAFGTNIVVEGWIRKAADGNPGGACIFRDRPERLAQLGGVEWMLAAGPAAVNLNGNRFGINGLRLFQHAQ